jgi:hypothetical protein
LKFQGTQNIVADPLSRMFESWSDVSDTIIFNIMLTKFPTAFQEITELHQDPELGKIISSPEKVQRVLRYFLFKGVLHCLSNTNHGQKIVALPATLPMLSDYFHNCVLGGHLETFKTIHKIRFYWEANGQGY